MSYEEDNYAGSKSMDYAASTARGNFGGSNGIGGLLQETSRATESTSSRIHAALEVADSRVNELHSTINELEKRLSYILAPSAPSVSPNDAKTPTPINSPVTDRLSSINARLAGTTLYLQHILGRLEL